MTLTVRLDSATESALERYCTKRGVTKSLVVQESLAVYLVNALPAGKEATPKTGTSANYKAFADAGLIGAIELGGVSATKEIVRARIAQAVEQRKARRGGA
jgi:predicted transcriptional regulator